VNFQAVLGDAVVEQWSLKREEKVVDVLMELIGAGLMPSKQLLSLDLTELGVSPLPPPFLPFLPVMPPVEPSAPRASRSTVQVSPPMALDMELPTGRKVPLPSWARGLVGLHKNLEKLALVEHIVLRHEVLAKHEHRADPDGEFKYVL
jgi:hypothetical protein